MNRALVAHATLHLVEDRIRELRRYEAWYRRNGWADWPDIRRENRAELRALLRIARYARRIAAAAPDPMDEAKRYAEVMA